MTHLTKLSIPAVLALLVSYNPSLQFSLSLVLVTVGTDVLKVRGIFSTAEVLGMDMVADQYLSPSTTEWTMTAPVPSSGDRSGVGCGHQP